MLSFCRGVSKYLIAAGLVVAWLVMGVGCASVSNTSRYYMPLVAQQFPPKSKETKIPILEEPPKRRFQIIGRFAFETDQNLHFIYKSLQYNAQKNGADAVIMRSLISKRREWTENRPPWVETFNEPIWVTNCYGAESLIWVSRPIFHPGYTIPMSETLTSVQAEMIVFQ